MKNFESVTETDTSTTAAENVHQTNLFADDADNNAQIDETAEFVTDAAFSL